MSEVLITIRLASLDDKNILLKLINAAFDVERFFIDADRIDLQELEQRFGKGNFILAEDNSEQVGCIYVEMKNDRAYFGLLAVSPTKQGVGLGRLLVKAAEDHAKKSGCKYMDIQIINLRTELPPFYKKLGYEEIEIVPFPKAVLSKIPCHFINMAKKLD